MPIIRAQEFSPQRGVLEVHLPNTLLPSNVTHWFLELVEIEECNSYDCGFAACTQICFGNPESGSRLAYRALRLLFGPKVYDHIREVWLVRMDSQALKEWQTLRITREQHRHIVGMIETDYKSVHPFGV